MAKIFKIFFSNLLTNWLEDIFVLMGIAVLLYTTYSWNVMVGNYLLGFILLLFGLLMSKR